ncbi:NUDIX hydrolase [Paenibacillus sp. FSL R7-0345]|uniref:NUDIX hydrolase n=1 Tax=Paenibacillus sp. FSL R7-0345 TaxID=2954535 RepID=UPI00315A206E
MKSFNHFGVYGICIRDGKLLLIHKGRGPYTGRYDLPGGRLESDEALIDGLVREFREETGLSVSVKNNLGTYDFFVRYQEDFYTHMHHIAALYMVEVKEDQQAAPIEMFAGQDSLGAVWVELEEISLELASPVAVLAAEWLAGGRLPAVAGAYDQWEMKQPLET